MTKKPTTADLVAAITSLQGLIELASQYGNDRNPNRAAQTNDVLDRAQKLCIEVRSEFPATMGYRGRYAKLDTPSTSN